MTDQACILILLFPLFGSLLAMLLGLSNEKYAFPVTLVALAGSLGAALLIPVVPSRVAGAGLTAFAAGLLGLYLRTPGMRHPQSLRPTEQGLPLSKDAWLLGAGLSLLLGGDTGRDHSRGPRRCRR